MNSGSKTKTYCLMISGRRLAGGRRLVSHLLTAAGVLLCSTVLPGCGDSSTAAHRPVTLSGSTMGTYYRVTLPSRPATMSGNELHDAIKERLDRINALMSTYLADSEVSRFNDCRDPDWFPVSTETATVVSEALQIFHQSEGAFDITVAPLVNLWGFGPVDSEARIPDPASIEKALAKTGARHLHVRLSPPSLKKDLADLQIDLSGIAKGFAVDSIAELLRSLGIADYLVDIGGEMLASGHKGDNLPWRIAIESPAATGTAIQRVIALEDLAIASSGDYRQYFEVDGHRYSHEIDPATGQPVRHQLVATSVLNNSCMRADAWATALMVMGPLKGPELAERTDLAALFITKQGEAFVETKSSRFRRLSMTP